MDVLTLQGLRYDAPHGYYKKEQTHGNQFEVDLEFHLELKKAGQTDDLTQTVDYDKAEKTVRQIMEGPSVKLLETLAWKIGERLLKKFQAVRQLEVRIRKLNPPVSTPAKYSEVACRWSR